MERTAPMNERYLDVIALRGRGYCCSQIMALMFLENRDEKDDFLVRAMGGLCNGVGDSGEVCGCLSGGACIVSLAAGKGSDEETAHEELPVMLFELTQWFGERTSGPYGGMRCDQILAHSPDKRACLDLVVETYERVLSILDAHDATSVG